MSPINVCETALTGSSSGWYYTSSKWICVDETVNDTTTKRVIYSARYDTDNCTGNVRSYWKPPTSSSYYLQFECDAPATCPYSVYHTNTTYGTTTEAVVTGLCYDAYGFTDNMSSRAWSMYTCWNGEIFRADYGLSNGQCSGKYNRSYIAEHYLTTGYFVSTCTDPIYLPSYVYGML